MKGFELHQGNSSAQAELQPLFDQANLGWIVSTPSGGSITGTYLHGLLENGPWRRHWLNQLRQRKNLAPLHTDVPHHAEQRERVLNRLADAFVEHIDIEPLLT